jgi:hypothetical protein
VSLENTAGAGADDVVQVNVFFADSPENFQTGNFFASGQVMLRSADSTSIFVNFPLDLNRSFYDFYVKAEVDAAEDVPDFNPLNNVLNARLTPDIFNVTPAAGSDTISVHPQFQVYFPPGSLSDSSAVKIRLVEFEKPSDQRGLIPVATLEEGKFHALEVQLLNKNAVLNLPFRMQIALTPALIDTATYNFRNIKLYQKSQPTQPWLSTLFPADDHFNLRANAQKSALYAPFITTDNRAPRIELTVDGRPLQVSGLVSNTPALYLSIQDESGINLQKEDVQILINNASLPEDKVLIPDSVQNNNALGITVYPELNNGKHILKVNVQDVNGNAAQREFELVVAEGFDIHVYGNYPNPFQDQTIFTYFVDLNDDLDEFEIRIYTVSGRFIRKIDSDLNNPIDAPDGGARRKGYNELIWDGHDNDGNEVANGVYFAVIHAAYEGETIEKILKVARLK